MSDVRTYPAWRLFSVNINVREMFSLNCFPTIVNLVREHSVLNNMHAWTGRWKTRLIILNGGKCYERKLLFYSQIGEENRWIGTMWLDILHGVPFVDAELVGGDPALIIADPCQEQTARVIIVAAGDIACFVEWLKSRPDAGNKNKASQSIWKCTEVTAYISEATTKQGTKAWWKHIQKALTTFLRSRWKSV